MVLWYWLEWAPTITSVLILLIIFAGKTWIKNNIEQSVRHNFDQKIEEFRTDLRRNEEKFKSELRSKEASIAALRDGVLNGVGHRQSIIESRRLEAVERVWTRVSLGLVPYKTVANTIARLNLDAATKLAATDEKMRNFFRIITSTIPEDDAKNNSMAQEEIFLSPLAWAYFSAYQTTLLLAYGRAKFAALGFSPPSEAFTSNALKATLKAALPHQSAYIEQNSLSSYHHLLDELEACIRGQLRLMLDGQEFDQVAVERAAKIMEEVTKVQTTMDEAKALPLTT